MNLSSRLQPRWLIGSAIGALLLSAILVSGPNGVRAQDATPTPTATETPAAEVDATEESVSEADINDGFAIGDLVIVADGPLNVRETAGIESDIVTTVAEASGLMITDGPESADDFVWYEVETDDGEIGWVASEFLATSSTSKYTVGDLLEVIDGPLNVRDSSDTSGEVATQLQIGETATVLDGPESGDGYDWYEIEIDSETSGWVAAVYTDQAASEDSFNAGDVVEVIDGPLNVREEGDTSADVIVQVETGESVTIVSGPETADGFSWYEVDVDSETSGWIASEFVGLAGNTDAAVEIAIGDGVRVEVDGANFRAEAGLDAEIIDNLDIDALLLVQDGPIEADGYTWYQVFNYYYGDGWIAGELVSVDPDGFPEGE